MRPSGYSRQDRAGESAEMVRFDAEGDSNTGLAPEHVGDSSAGCAEDLDARRGIDGVGVRRRCALGNQFEVDDH